MRSNPTPDVRSGIADKCLQTIASGKPIGVEHGDRGSHARIKLAVELGWGREIPFFGRGRAEDLDGFGSCHPNVCLTYRR